MQPVIPLQPYIREGEGSGSAYELPIGQGPSVLDPLVRKLEQHAADKKLENAATQKDLMEISNLKANLLPKHQQKFLEAKNAYLDFVINAKKSGQKPFEPGTTAYAEKQKRYNELEALAKTGEYLKNYVVENAKEHVGKEGVYEPNSFSELKNRVEDMDLSNVDAMDLPVLKKAFNDIEYTNKFKQGRSPVYSYSEAIVPAKTTSGQTIRGQYIRKETPSLKNEKQLTEEFISGLPESGKINYLKPYIEMQQNNPAEYEKIKKSILANNASADPDKNPQLFEKELLKYHLGPKMHTLFKMDEKVTNLGEQMDPNYGYNAGQGSYKKNGIIATTNVEARTPEDIREERIMGFMQSGLYPDRASAERAADYSSSKTPYMPVNRVQTTVNPDKNYTINETTFKDKNGEAVIGRPTDFIVEYAEGGVPTTGGTITIMQKQRKGPPVPVEIPLDEDNFRALTAVSRGVDFDEVIRNNTNGRYGLPSQFAVATKKEQGGEGKVGGSQKPKPVQKSGGKKVIKGF